MELHIFFYSGSLLTNKEYEEQEKDYINQKEKARNWNYTAKRDFDISNPIDKEKAKAYLDGANKQFESLASQFTFQALDPLQKYIKDNETEFQKIFGNDVYKDVLAWKWK